MTHARSSSKRQTTHTGYSSKNQKDSPPLHRPAVSPLPGKKKKKTIEKQKKKAQEAESHFTARMLLPIKSQTQMKRKTRRDQNSRQKRSTGGKKERGN
jgi:hypothetical protein